jgi:LAS superfamily LD-carboxypeptidase LdcB
MVQAAKDDGGVNILINSAFRTFQRQAELFDLMHHGGNTAAPPGSSNHQHGQAFDLNTGHNVFNGSDKVYEWLRKNGPKHGFIRTVNNESWHWEYRPRDAAQMGPGKFKLPPNIT